MIPELWLSIFALPSNTVTANPSRTSIHFLQESVRFHFQDLGRPCIIIAGILEDLGRKCLILQDLARNV